MKTPKRHLFIKCPICDWEYSAEEHYCPLCEFGIPQNTKSETQRKTRARWKRKNKEAQLKRTIARLRRIERRKLRQDKLLNLYRARVAQLKWDMNGMEFELATTEDNNNELRKQNLVLSNSILRVYTRGCFGHDIEGS